MTEDSVAKTRVRNSGLVVLPHFYKSLRRRLQSLFDMSSSPEIVVCVETKFEEDKILFELVARNRDKPYEIFLKVNCTDGMMLVFEERWKREVTENLESFQYTDQFGQPEDVTLEMIQVQY